MSNNGLGSGTLLIPVTETLSMPAAVLLALPACSKSSNLSVYDPGDRPTSVWLNGF